MAIWTSDGRSFCNSAKRLRIALQTATVLAPVCFWMIMTTALSPPSPQPYMVGSSKLSLTSATSRRWTRRPSWVPTMIEAISSGEVKRPVSRIWYRRVPIFTSPAGMSRFSALIFWMTSGTVRP